MSKQCGQLTKKKEDDLVQKINQLQKHLGVKLKEPEAKKTKSAAPVKRPADDEFEVVEESGDNASPAAVQENVSRSTSQNSEALESAQRLIQQKQQKKL